MTAAPSLLLFAEGIFWSEPPRFAARSDRRGRLAPAKENSAQVGPAVHRSEPQESGVAERAWLIAGIEREARRGDVEAAGRELSARPAWRDLPLAELIALRNAVAKRTRRQSASLVAPLRSSVALVRPAHLPAEAWWHVVPDECGWFRLVRLRGWQTLAEDGAWNPDQYPAALSEANTRNARTLAQTASHSPTP